MIGALRGCRRVVSTVVRCCDARVVLQLTVNQLCTNTHGAYCLSIASKLIFLAAFRYLRLSSLRLELIVLICSRLSPLQSKSSMFLVMILVTSWRSELSRSRLELVEPGAAPDAAAADVDADEVAASAERASAYTRFVFCKKVSEESVDRVAVNSISQCVHSRTVCPASRLTKTDESIRPQAPLSHLVAIRLLKLPRQLIEEREG